MPRRLMAALLAILLILPSGPPASAQPQTITLDGQLDATGYTLIAQDPSGDTAAVFSSAPETSWTDLTALYVASDTTNLYLFAALPAYNNSSSTGEFGLAIDTTGDVPNSGGAFDPWSNPITYAYTSTLNNLSAAPHATANTILPDFVIRGRILGYPDGTDISDGWTEFFSWSGSAWADGGENWGGLEVLGPPVGDHIAYLSGNGVELAIPFTDLGIGPTATVNLQLYPSRRVQVEGSFGAVDTLPSDAQSASEHAATVQKRLSTWPPPPPAPPGPCGSALVGDGLVITNTLTHLDTDVAYRSPTGTLQAGQSATLTLRSCASDLTSAAVLVWDPGDLLSAPAHTYTLTASASPPANTRWTVVVPPPLTAYNRQYEFRLSDGSATSYYHPAQGQTGPGQWSASLQSSRWLLAMLGAPPPLEWRLFLPYLDR